MFSTPKIFSDIPGLVSYVWDKTLPMRPRQFHDESPEYKEWVRVLEETFGIEKIFFMAQCQSDEILEITDLNCWAMHHVDACYTRLHNISLNVVVADCVPILFYVRAQHIVWVVHAGWRWSTAHILLKTLNSLRENYNSRPEDILLYLWPSISQKYYEVGEDVTLQFSDESVICKDEKYYLDLRWENLRQVREFWIPERNIEVSDECTYEFSEKYFSYRREWLRKNFVCGMGLREVWK